MVPASEFLHDFLHRGDVHIMEGSVNSRGSAQVWGWKAEKSCHGGLVTNAQPDDRYLAIKVVMMPRDTNPYGTIFGGVILSYTDQAGAVGARHEIRRAGWPDQPIVSVAMKSVEFHRPVVVGDTVSFWTSLVKVGRTSITMHVDVETDRHGEIIHLTEAEVTYVAVELSGGQRRTVPIRG